MRAPGRRVSSALLLLTRVRTTNGLVVELAFAFLVQQAIASGTTAADVHPVRGHHHDRPWAEILGGGVVRAGVENTTDDHALDFTAVRVKRVVRSGGYHAHLRVLSLRRVARE